LQLRQSHPGAVMAGAFPLGALFPLHTFNVTGNDELILSW